MASFFPTSRSGRRVSRNTKDSIFIGNFDRSYSILCRLHRNEISKFWLQILHECFFFFGEQWQCHGAYCRWLLRLFTEKNQFAAVARGSVNLVMWNIWPAHGVGIWPWCKVNTSNCWQFIVESIYWLSADKLMQEVWDIPTRPKSVLYVVQILLIIFSCKIRILRLTESVSAKL